MRAIGAYLEVVRIIGVAVASETAGSGFVGVLEGEGAERGGVLSLEVPADGSQGEGGGVDECGNKEGRIITERLRQALKADARRQHAAWGMNSLRSTVEATEGRATEDGENGGENAFHFGIG